MFERDAHIAFVQVQGLADVTALLFQSYILCVLKLMHSIT
jgi:hypothetical protein